MLPLKCFDWRQLIFGTLILAASATTFAWTIVDLGTLANPNGITAGSAVAIRINNAGAVVGQSENANFNQRAFIWTQSTGMLDLGTLGADWSVASGIDLNGYVSGTSGTALVNPSGTHRAFISGANGGTISSLGLLNGKATRASGISPDGNRRVIGHTAAPNNSYVLADGFISEPNGGALSLLPKPVGATHCVPYRIGVGGRIVGNCNGETIPRAYISYIFGTGSTSYLATAAGAKFRAWAVNPSNQIVGRVAGPSGFFSDGRAMLWNINGSFTILDQQPVFAFRRQAQHGQF